MFSVVAYMQLVNSIGLVITTQHHVLVLYTNVNLDICTHLSIYNFLPESKVIYIPKFYLHALLTLYIRNDSSLYLIPPGSGSVAQDREQW